ncbi:MAG: T9SS type A sorting domain-containing protein [Muribaculaceae bacterium]|nr:T9SS type A sorting domain-containing protein [Muribaculaceae bacterium]
MKKFFTLVLAITASALSMMAADILYFGNTPVKDGDTYTVNPVVDFQDGDYVEYKQDADLFFHGTVGQSFTVEVTSTESVQVCALDGQCAFTTPGQPLVKTGSIKKDMESAMIDNTGELADLKPNTINVKVTSGGTTVSCTVIFTTDPAGAGVKAAAAEEYVRMASGNTLAYSINGASTLQIYAMTGAQVGRYRIEGKGTVNLGSLPKGVYIYTDGSHKGKFVVR